MELEGIVFADWIKGSLKQEIEKDLLEFDLEVTKQVKEDITIDAVRDNPSCISIACGVISSFKYPKGSLKQEIKNRGYSAISNNYKDIMIQFNYNEKSYMIFGSV